MARSKGIIKISGTLGGISFYNRNGQELTRIANAPDKKKMQNNPNYIRTKQNSESKDQVKPDSQKDILDFFDEERSEKRTPLAPVTPVLLEEKAEKPIIETIEELTPLDVRQTFVIGSDYLEKTKNYVHLQRLNGSYEYSQKNALHDALDLLFKDLDIPERPQRIKDKEKNRADRIKLGKKG